MAISGLIVALAGIALTLRVERLEREVARLSASIAERKLDTLGANDAAHAETIAASKRGPGVTVKVSRFRIGPRTGKPWYSWQVHVYAKD